MPPTERPPLKLPNGKRNPDYDKWHRAKKKEEKAPVAATLPEDMESEAGSSPDPAPEVLTGNRAGMSSIAAAVSVLDCNPFLSAAGTGLQFDPVALVDSVTLPPEHFQSAAEPEQTSNDPREPDVPALEAPSEESEILTIRVVKEAKNPRFVYADLDGKKVPVAIKKGQGRRMLKKKIPVKVETIGEKTIYTHVR